MRDCGRVSYVVLQLSPAIPCRVAGKLVDSLYITPVRFQHICCPLVPDSVLDIPEVRELEAGQSLIRVPMEQNVPFTRRVRAIVDTPQFQRLGAISQLGMVSKVYPGARHTRLEHALGVYHNALRYLRQLANDARFTAVIGRREGELLIVAALLHDLGHWPFCHPIEDMALAGMPPHEVHAATFLQPDSELAEVLRNDWGIAPGDVLDVLAPRTDSLPLRLLRSIISGPIDVDKLDYLERDSLHCGVPYGRNFDKQRLIQSLVVNEQGDGLAITSKGKTAAELMVFARYVMFAEVYWHHAVRAATTMFARAFYEVHTRCRLDELFLLDDAEMVATLRASAAGTASAPLFEGLFGRGRRLYKRAAEFSDLQSPEMYQRFARRPFAELATLGNRLAERMSAYIGRRLSPTDVLLDAPPPHREIEFSVDVFFPKTGEYRPLRGVSPVVEALARTQFDDYVKRVRIFVAPEVRREWGDDRVWEHELALCEL
jgi:HD superfamily phosphohydrolase